MLIQPSTVINIDSERFLLALKIPSDSDLELARATTGLCHVIIPRPRTPAKKSNRGSDDYFKKIFVIEEGKIIYSGNRSRSKLNSIVHILTFSAHNASKERKTETS
ncbi:hypothetical protein RRG08_049484 [Elysia crispata]|uniref:Uncharacterized protein n=1 Tax=Elysia crispata TaxID=231223 RepID=A0AAE0ZS15_9GAST|nr:hypothetical protein RRG08_049484 [Elysia crispata]